MIFTSIYYIFFASSVILYGAGFNNLTIVCDSIHELKLSFAKVMFSILITCILSFQFMHFFPDSFKAGGILSTYRIDNFLDYFNNFGNCCSYNHRENYFWIYFFVPADFIGIEWKLEFNRSNYNFNWWLYFFCSVDSCNLFNKKESQYHWKSTAAWK